MVMPRCDQYQSREVEDPETDMTGDTKTGLDDEIRRRDRKTGSEDEWCVTTDVRRSMSATVSDWRAGAFTVRDDDPSSVERIAPAKV
jgi:hypothetical protein